MFRQNYAGAQIGTIGTVAACANAIEPIAGSDDPRVRSGALQVLSKVLKYRGVFGRYGSKVVDCFIYAGCDTCGGHVVAKDSSVHDLREKSGLRNEFANQVRDVFLPFRREGFLISRAASESDDDYFPLLRGSHCPCEGTGMEQRASQGHTGRHAQKFAAVSRKAERSFERN